MRTEIVAAWEKAAKSPLYLVAHDATTHPYVETPEEQGAEDAEGLVRAFSSEEEALLYIMALETYVDDKLVIMEVPWESVFRFIPFQTTGYPITLTLSVVAEGEWPRSVDTIWTTCAEVH